MLTTSPKPVLLRLYQLLLIIGIYERWQQGDRSVMASISRAAGERWMILFLPDLNPLSVRRAFLVRSNL